MATNGNNGAQFTSTNAPSTVSATSGGAEPSSDSNLGKDEVAWFFVEQYYTTLSKTPEKLHLFYGKRSQFVVGREAEVANVSVGRQSIQERLKQLDLQDCKVRVSNVDSQASYDNIVIQVIGETSNKAGTPKKFVQTFVLAQQPSGYFVLNDLLRYIDDEGDEENTEEETAAAVEAPVEIPAPEAEAEQPTETSASVGEAAAPALDAGVVDKKLEEVSAAPEPVNGDAPKTETAAEADAPETSSQPNPEATLQELVAEEIKEPEKPADPSPTPVQSRQPAPPLAAPAPTGPPKPMTWASRAAAAAVPKPVTPLPKTATPPTQARPAAASATQAASAAPSSTTAAAAPVAAPAATASEDAGPAKESSEWQTAGSDSKRQGKPQATTGAQTEKEGTMGYVKYVTDKVKHDELKQALAQHGEVVYFDINRQKNCAFVEFATIAGYQAAVAANPHVINGESIQVEPRRPKAGAYGGSNYASGRGGGAPSRGGRGGFESGRSGSSGGRGNFGGPRGGRGGAGAGTGAPRGGAGGAWSTA